MGGRGCERARGFETLAVRIVVKKVPTQAKVGLNGAPATEI